jgi:cytosine/adenosine deaminase-related metal-dependent hydrolase
VLEFSDGTGISGANDMPYDALAEAVEKAKKAGKTAGIHAGELNRSDIDTAIDTMPDFLVHMTQAIDADIQKVADRGLPVVTCPRSNAVTGGGIPPIKKMAEAGLTMALGTDNVMLNSPDMFREMEWTSKAFLHDDAYTLKMATLNGARLLGMEKETGSILPGKRAELLVLDGSSDNLRGHKNALSAIVRRAGPDDVSCFICGDRIWRRYSTEYS